ncbi:single-stranded DNA-binding protein [Leptotrichia sp. oral taxon 847]|uniref:single-stranded DNA-binding protein n=1 Tax=Leptotrichia sp. oral taxon 847 TaxID=1785996 RepID=UPI0009EB5214|nr:single-stranded DNA-binding protein [Leptotrichia sp. oral taxon 847]
MNNVILMGRLTRDPELNQSSGGKAFVRFTVAINRIGEGTDFINCVAWEKTAKTISDYFKKGQRILVQGSIRTGSYEKNGQTIYTTDILVNRFEFIESSGNNTNNGNYSDEYQNSYKKSKKSFKQQEEIFEDKDSKADEDDFLNKDSNDFDDNDDDEDDDQFPF